MGNQTTMTFLAWSALALVGGMFVGAFVLRAAVALYNKLAGVANSSDAVPEPLFGPAMEIVFLATLANCLAGFCVGMFLNIVIRLSTGSGAGAIFYSQIVSLPIGVLVLAGVLKNKLPANYKQAFAITLCYLMIGLVLAVDIGLPLIKVYK